jgi:hypothetical protein
LNTVFFFFRTSLANTDIHPTAFLSRITKADKRDQVLWVED